MWEFFEAPDVVVAIGTLLAGGAACVGAYAALSGLSAWKAQVEWQRDTELARTLVVQLKNRLDSFEKLTFLFTPYGELASALGRDFEVKNRCELATARWEAIEQRKDRLFAARNEMSPLLATATLFWGGVLEKFTIELEILERQVIDDFQELLTLQEIIDPTPDNSAEIGRLERRIYSKDAGEVGGEYAEVSSRIESFLARKCLGKKAGARLFADSEWEQKGGDSNA